MKIRSKLLMILITVGLLPVLIISLLLFTLFTNEISEASFDKLTATRDNRAMQIEDYFSFINGQVKTMSSSTMIIDAMKEFDIAFRELNEQVTPAQLNQAKSGVQDYISNEFVPRLEANTMKSETVDQFLTDLPATNRLQYLYIANNTNEVGSKHLLMQASDGSRYSATHGKYHPAIKEFLEEFGYYDIFLVDIESGNIIYSVFKEADYATSLLDGPYANTNFAMAFKEASQATDPSTVVLKDFDFYVPSYNAPASFIASPIYDSGTKVGVLVFQMPVDKINGIMTGDGNWEASGLGLSGETYLVGADNRMRSISRFLVEDKAGYINTLRGVGYGEDQLNSIDIMETSILYQDVNSVAAQKAISGQTGTEIV